ncbi:MAG: hypothetical protein Aurels2KO_50790 [Aureliella sp.]
MSRELIVKLVSAHSRLPSELVDALRPYGIELAALHPSVNDASLATYYYSLVSVPHDQEDEILRKVLHCDSVDGSYFKSQGSEPM